MNIIFKTRYPVRIQRILLLLVILATTGIYFYQAHTPKRNPEKITYLALTPMVPELPQVNPAPTSPAKPVTTTVEIQKNQTFNELMQDQGFDPATIQEILESSNDVYNLGQINAGKSME